MQPLEVIDQAIKGDHLIKGVATRLGRHKNTVYKMLSGPEHCLYTRFLQLLFAIDAENPAGAFMIVEDLNARFQLLHERAGAGAELRSVDWLDGVSKVVKETSESIQEAIAHRDSNRLLREIAEAIESLRRLQKMTLARAGDQCAVGSGQWAERKRSDGS
jgi:hypothetical protein